MPENDLKQNTNRNHKLFIILAIVIAIAFIICCCITALIVIYSSNSITTEPETQEQIPNTITVVPSNFLNITPTITAPSGVIILPTNTGSSPKFKPNTTSIYNENIQSPPVPQSQLSELALTEALIAKLSANGWQGNPDDINLNFTDLDSSLLPFIRKNEADREGAFTIPEVFRYELYTSDQAQAEIKQLVMTARTEYLDFLRSKRVAEKYITELDKYVLPLSADRYIISNDYDVNGDISYVEGHRDPNGTKHYDTLDMHISNTNIYNDARLITKSQILGAEPTETKARTKYQKQAREMGARRQVYHEMTHALQRAYNNVNNVDSSYKNTNTADRYRSETLSIADTKYFYTWGGLEQYDDENAPFYRNINMSKERQADGVSFEALSLAYNISPEQNSALWGHLFDRLDQSYNQVNNVHYFFTKNNATFQVGNLPEILRSELNLESLSIEDSYTIKLLFLRLGGLDIYAGYFNPMSVNESDEFWNLLRQ